MKTIANNTPPVSSLKYFRTVPFDCTGLVEAKTPGTLRIEIRLNDECRNGHEDFAITAEINHPTVRRDCLACGCLHDEILEAAPEFAPFVALHLCDAHGAPMHAIANARFWLVGVSPDSFPEDGTKPSESPEKCRAFLRSHLRCTDEEIDTILATGARSSDELSVTLEDMGFRARWQGEATAAIRQLEKLTGAKFATGETRQNWPKASPETVAAVKELRASGHYSPEAVEARKTAKMEEKKAAKLAEIEKDYERTVSKATDARLVKRYFAARGIPDDNVIFYDHTRTLAFNWQDSKYRTYSKTWTREEFDAFTASAEMSELPAGLRFEFRP